MSTPIFSRPGAMRPFPPRRVSGLLLLLAVVLNLGAVVMYAASDGSWPITESGWVVETPTYHAWERALLMSSYVAAALGAAVLEPAIAEAGASILGRLAAVAFPMAASVALVMEAVSIEPAEFRPGSHALIVVVVLLLFGAEVLLGAAVLASRLVPAWVGWTAIVWNLAWPTILPIVSPGDPYYPILHAIPLLMISIPLIQRGRQLSSPAGVTASPTSGVMNVTEGKGTSRS
jgi:hypothetical protein